MKKYLVLSLLVSTIFTMDCEIMVPEDIAVTVEAALEGRFDDALRSGNRILDDYLIKNVEAHDIDHIRPFIYSIFLCAPRTPENDRMACAFASKLQKVVSRQHAGLEKRLSNYSQSYAFDLGALALGCGRSDLAGAYVLDINPSLVPPKHCSFAVCFLQATKRSFPGPTIPVQMIDLLAHAGRLQDLADELASFESRALPQGSALHRQYAAACRRAYEGLDIHGAITPVASMQIQLAHLRVKGPIDLAGSAILHRLIDQEESLPMKVEAAGMLMKYYLDSGDVTNAFNVIKPVVMSLNGRPDLEAYPPIKRCKAGMFHTYNYLMWVQRVRAGQIALLVGEPKEHTNTFMYPSEAVQRLMIPSEFRTWFAEFVKRAQQKVQAQEEVCKEAAGPEKYSAEWFSEVD